MTHMQNPMSALHDAEQAKTVPCFTPGTMIATPTGLRAVESLVVGDRILTRDNGIREISWLSHKPVTQAQLTASPQIRPVLFKAGCLSKGLPDRNMLVSPQHRMLVVSDRAKQIFRQKEVFVPAKHMTQMLGVDVVQVPETTYIHFMFNRHEVVLANGSWTESFQPNDFSLKAVDKEQRVELLALFPELATSEGQSAFRSARRVLKKMESMLLTR